MGVVSSVNPISNSRRIFAAVGGSVRKARGERDKYTDVDFAVACEGQTAYDLQQIVENVAQNLNWPIHLRGGETAVVGSYDVPTAYSIWEDPKGEFDGWRIRFQPPKGATLDLTVISSATFDAQKYGRSAEEWLRAQKEQGLPYVVLHDTAPRQVAPLA